MRRILVGGVFLCSVIAASAQVFTGLGLPTGFFQSRSLAVSGDGQVVLVSEDSLDNAIWSSGSGFSTLPNTTAISFTFRSLSADGSLALGRNNSTGRAVLYDVTNGTSVTSTTNFTPMGMNASGTWVAGEAPGNWAAIWNTSTNVITTLPDFGFSFATDVSDDGTVVVGSVQNENFFSPSLNAAVWTNGVLQTFPSVVIAGAVSSDGSRWAGFTHDGNFVRYSDGSLEIIARASGPYNNGVVMGMSDAGDAFVGVQFGAGEMAVYWSASLGLVNLQEHLISLGLGSQLDGWTLTRADGISADGLTIIGQGIHNGVSEAFVVSLAAIPEPSTYAIMVGVLCLVSAVGHRWRIRRLQRKRNTFS